MPIHRSSPSHAVRRHPPIHQSVVTPLNAVAATTLGAVASLDMLRAPRRVHGAPASKVSGSAHGSTHVPGEFDALEGEVSIVDREVTLRIVLEVSFPRVLPRIFLVPWDALGFIPHVDASGLICFTDPEGLVLDRRRPVDLVQDGLERALAILEAGVTGRNIADFTDEFEWYWRRLPGGQEAISLLEPGLDIGRVPILLDANGQPRFVGDPFALAAFCNGKGRPTEGAYRMAQALYLPLEPGTLLIPPRLDRPMWTAAEARHALLSTLPPQQRTRLRELLADRPASTKYSTDYVIVRLPRPSGGASLFGVSFDGVGHRHPLAERGEVLRLTPLSLRRLDRSFLIQRGGGGVVLSTKRVLIAGVGAVGGHVTFELARAGVGHLALVDDDVLTEENSFRHVLGRQHWRERKAMALKHEIEAELPYVRVSAITKRLEVALLDGTIRLGDYDLIVLALGNPTVELDINQQVHTLPNGPLAVFTWVEPLGLGGHALLTNNGADGGCFECLYTPSSAQTESGDDVEGADEPLKNRAAFAAYGQSFGRALSGCGSLHTPYGALDAAQTALTASRLAVEALTGKEPGNPLRSWKGDAAAFTAAGFRVSTRFGATGDGLERQRYLYRAERCQVCGAKHQGAQDVQDAQVMMEEQRNA